MNLGIVYPYYNNQRCVEQQIKVWTRFPAKILRHLQFVLVDDCSTIKIPDKLYNDANLNLIVVRVKDDIKWNQAGAHNLGMKLVETDWVFSGDIDHVLNEETCHYLLKMDKDDDTVYYFYRLYHRNNQMINLPEAPNIIMIKKENFWNLGGYDEDFCGHYGYEDKLFQNLIRMKYKCHSILSVKVHVLNAPTRGLDRDTIINKSLLNKKLEQFSLGHYKNKDVIRFKWETLINKKFREQ